MNDDNSIKNTSTSLNAYLQVIFNEYNREIQKKQGIEGRCGFVIAFLAAFGIYIINSVKIRDFFLLIEPLTIISLFKLLFGTVIYLSLITCLFCSLLELIPRKRANFNVTEINDEDLAQDETYGLYSIVFNYREIIEQQRYENEKCASWLEKSIKSLCVSFVFYCLYVNLFS